MFTSAILQTRAYTVVDHLSQMMTDFRQQMPYLIWCNTFEEHISEDHIGAGMRSDTEKNNHVKSSQITNEANAE